MRATSAILLGALSAVASALHGFSSISDDETPPHVWQNFVHDDDFTLHREGNAFFAFKHRNDADGLVPCFELFNGHDDQLVYVTEAEVGHFESIGYLRTGEEFFLFDHQRAHTVPLLRTKSHDGQFLFTIDFHEAAVNDFFADGFVGFVHADHVHGTRGVRRWFLEPRH